MPSLLYVSCVATLALAKILVVASHQAVNAKEVAEQMHLSFSGKESSMVVDFVCPESNTAYVEYSSLASFDPPLLLQAATNGYFDNVGFLYHAEMSQLDPQQKYKYRLSCGSSDSLSFDYWIEFTAGSPKRTSSDRRGEPPQQQQSSLSSSSIGDGIAAVFADFGLDNDVSMRRLTLEGALGEYDFLQHVGDIAYNLMDEENERGNKFMRLVSKFAASKPLMVAPGNHEHSDNFTNYNRRFSGIQAHAGSNSESHSNFFYSYDVGLTHFIMINTEVYKYQNAVDASDFPFTAEEQLTWLEADLIAANTNREQVPWIVMMGHKGWYMDYFGDFRVQDEITGNFTGFDDLGCKYGVDLYLTGHVHIYQRFLPVKGPSQKRAFAPPADVDRDCASEDGHTYTDPKYMPTIVVASPGDQEISPRVSCLGLDLVDKIFWDESQQYCTAAYGFGHLQAVNATHMYWEFVQTGRADNITVLKPDDYSDADVQQLLQHSLPAEWITLTQKQLQQQQQTDDSSSAEEARQQLQQMAAKLQLQQQAHGEFDIGDVVERGVGKSRLVRDHLWIVQHNHGTRDYCNSA